MTATYVDTRTGGAPQKVTADWCVCTFRLGAVARIPMNVSAKKKVAINVIPYGAGLKVGLQMKRRFWEEDERIYGGLTYTSQPNAMIGYPMWDYFSKGKGVLLGAYVMGAGAFLFASKPPEQRIAGLPGIWRESPSRQIQGELRMRRGRSLAPRALDAGLFRSMERRESRCPL